jgi:hypothetical protein
MRWQSRQSSFALTAAKSSGDGACHRAATTKLTVNINALAISHFRPIPRTSRRMTATSKRRRLAATILSTDFVAAIGNFPDNASPSARIKSGRVKGDGDD